jgi:hypothetical protein
MYHKARLQRYVADWTQSLSPMGNAHYSHHNAPTAIPTNHTSFPTSLIENPHPVNLWFSRLPQLISYEGFVHHEFPRGFDPSSGQN